MKGAERERRNAQIVHAHVRGIPLRTIARSFDVTERQVRRILEDWRERQPSFFDASSVERAEEMLSNYDSAINELALIEMRADKDADRVRAIRAKAHYIQKKIELLRLLGLLPREIDRRPSPIEVAPLLRDLRRVWREAGVPDAVQDESREVVIAWAESVARDDVPSPL